jgi:hypothetical protein
MFMLDGSDGEAERVSRLSRVANLQQPRSTRKSTLFDLYTQDVGAKQLESIPPALSAKYYTQSLRTRS